MLSTTTSVHLNPDAYVHVSDHARKSDPDAISVRLGGFPVELVLHGDLSLVEKVLLEVDRQLIAIRAKRSETEELQAAINAAGIANARSALNPEQVA